MDAAKFTAWVKLRNILAHEYLDLKWARISGFVKESRQDFAKFVDSAKNISPNPFFSLQRASIRKRTILLTVLEYKPC